MYGLHVERVGGGKEACSIFRDGGGELSKHA
jgi:hypothetical protein